MESMVNLMVNILKNPLDILLMELQFIQPNHTTNLMASMVSQTVNILKSPLVILLMEYLFILANHTEDRIKSHIAKTQKNQLENCLMALQFIHINPNTRNLMKNLMMY